MEVVVVVVVDTSKVVGDVTVLVFTVRKDVDVVVVVSVRVLKTVVPVTVTVVTLAHKHAGNVARARAAMMRLNV